MMLGFVKSLLNCVNARGATPWAGDCPAERENDPRGGAHFSRVARQRAELGRAAVELIGEKAAEQTVVRPVEVRRRAAQQAELRGAVREQHGLMLVVGDVE